MASKKDKTSTCLVGELLDSANALPRRLNGVETLRFSLQELKQRSQALNANRESAAKAHYLMMNGGVNVEDVMARLDKLSQKQLLKQQQVVKHTPASTPVPVNAGSGTEISEDNTFKDFVNSNIQIDWKVRKRELKDKLSGVLKRDASVTITSEESKKPKDVMLKQLEWGTRSNQSLISSNFKFVDVDECKDSNGLGNNPSPQISIRLRKKFEAYAQVIYSLNDAREKKADFPLCQSFVELARKNRTGTSDQFIEALEIVKCVCESEDKFKGQLKDAYCAKDLGEFGAVSLRNYYTRKSRGYLETQFSRFVNDMYSKSLAGQAVRTSKPISAIDKITNFINLTLKDESGSYKVPHVSVVNGTPIWAVVFYCLRGGFNQEAVEFLKKYEDSFDKIEKFFPFYLREYLEAGNLTTKTWGRINNEFNQYLKLSSDADPFKIAIYKLLGKLDLSKRSVSGLPLSIEDWLWLQLALINEGDQAQGDVLGEGYTLLDLQRNVMEFGESAFNCSRANPMYLQTLVLVGLNEEAVRQCMAVDEIDAIHLAIVLSYYGLLRTAANGEGRLVKATGAGFVELDFNQLIGYYVKFFKHSDPVVSAEYILLMDEQAAALGATKELVLQSGEFVLLLGTVDQQGRRHGGVLEKRRALLGLDSLEAYLQEICESGARRLEFEGRIVAAISLYQLGEQYDTALRLMNEVLVDMGDADAEALGVARRLLSMYEANAEVRAKVRGSSLGDLAKILKVYELEESFKRGGNASVLLNEVRRLELVPLDGGVEEVKRQAGVVNTSEGVVRKIVPRVLSLAVDLLQAESGPDRRDRAQSLMVFCGLLEYKMPREVYAKVVALNGW